MTDPDHRRLYVDKQTPTVHRAQIRVAMAVRQAADAAGLSRALLELVNVRVSQLNGCGPCLNVHVFDAVKQGVPEQLLAVLPAWREVDLFGDDERAALEVAEAVTLLGDADHLDARLRTAREQLGDERYSALVWAAINMNAFNRVSIISHHPVPPRP